jgi:hypothetical protein
MLFSHLLRGLSLLVFTATSLVVALPTNSTVPITDDLCLKIHQQGWPNPPKIPTILHTDTQTEEAIQGTDETNVFTPTEALSCLKSVPFDKALALDLTTSWRLFFDFYSMQAWFKQPQHAELDLPVFDITAAIDQIEAKVRKGDYDNGFQFMREVAIASLQFYDGHTSFVPICAGPRFAYYHDYTLMSIGSSADGEREIWSVDMTEPGMPPKFQTQVKKINGFPAADYLVELSRTLPDLALYGLQDPDARYNGLFAEWPAQTSGSFAQRSFFAGEEEEKLNITFADGKTVDVEWKASFTEPYVGIFNESSFQRICYNTPVEMSFFEPSFAGPMLLGHTSEASYNSITSSLFSVLTATLVPTTVPTATTTPTVTADIEERQEPTATATPSATAVDEEPSDAATLVGFPEPLSSALNITAFDDPDGDSEVGIITMPTFDPAGLNNGEEWSTVLNDTIANFTLAGKKRLILDITGNGGGIGLLAKKTARILFPAEFDGSGEPDYYLNNRYTPALDKMFRSNYSGYYFDEALLFSKLDGENITTDEVLGPYYNKHVNDSFTKITLWKEDQNDTDGNFGSIATYKKEDVIVIGNGACGSTCHNFMELMERIGVRSYAYGGRPGKKHMQSVGGTKGGTVLDYIPFIKETFYTLGDTTNHTDVPKFTRTRMASGRVGMENQFRLGATDTATAVPLYFVWTPACKKIPLTREMATDVTEIWKYAKNAAWKDGKALACDPVDKEDLSAEESTTVADKEAVYGDVETVGDHLGKLIWTHMNHNKR